MKSFFKKHELAFALICIGVYTVGLSACEELGRTAGLIWAPALGAGVLSALLLILVICSGQQARYGLCRAKVPLRAYLWFVPLVLITLNNVWNGAAMPADGVETALFVAKMLCVGFLEELIFRGFLFRAMSANGGLTAAMIVSSVTFGLGHIINLVNGSGMSLGDNLIQIVAAMVIGYLYVLLFFRGGSLWPCICSHGVLNALSAFAVPTAPERAWIGYLILLVLTVGYILALNKTMLQPDTKTQKSI